MATIVPKQKKSSQSTSTITGTPASSSQDYIKFVEIVNKQSEDYTKKIQAIANSLEKTTATLIDKFSEQEKKLKI